MAGKSFFHIQVDLTWSKIMALVILADSSVLDCITKSDGRVFMYALPFVVALIGNKQITDTVKEIRNKFSNNGS